MKMRYEAVLWVMWAIKGIPGQIGVKIRHRLLPSKLGQGVSIWENVHIDHPSRLTVGEKTSINRGCILNCSGHLSIGSNVLIGPNVTVYTQNHNYKHRQTLINEQGYDQKKVVIESDVWIASNAVILPGVTIAEGCVIGASSVVTKSTEPYGVYAGTPAKLLFRRI